MDIKSLKQKVSSTGKNIKGYTEEAIEKTNAFVKEKELDKKAKEVGNKIADVAATTGKATANVVRKGKEKVDEQLDKMHELDDELRTSVDNYNAAYTILNDHGTMLFVQRERSVDLIENIEKLINSIAQRPKSFDADIKEITTHKEQFRNTCDFAKEELLAAQKSAVGVGAGVAGGMAVAALAPSAAMWIATTFGTASTGTAISALSGAAATNAALAWLGGGVAATGGGGMAAGSAFLALAGPIGWSIAGATILTSVVIFANKKTKLNKEKAEEIQAVLRNIEKVNEMDTKLNAILTKTVELRDKLSGQYDGAMLLFGKNFLELPEEEQMKLGTLVNNAKALSYTLNENVSE